MTVEPAEPGAPVERVKDPIRARAAVRGVVFLQLLANGAGAFAVVVYLQLLYPGTTPIGGEVAALNNNVFGLYLLATLIVAIPINRRFLTEAMGWVRDGREPTPIERWATLTQPLQQTISAFLIWLGAAIIFGFVNRSRDNGLRVAAGIALAGMITCTLLYQLLERHFRPIFALALVNANLPRWRREIQARLMIAWTVGSAIPLIAVGLAPIGLSADELSKSGGRITILVVTGVVAGGLVMLAASRSVSEPIEQVSDALSQVEDGDLEVELAVTHVGEIGRLQHGLNAMVTGLRERRQLQELFGRQVGTDVAIEALANEPQLGGEARYITALFVDLDNFTSYTENHTPEEVVTELNLFFEVVIRIVMREGGWVNKFEGDAALCIFGAPAAQPDHAARALRAAAALPIEVAKLPNSPAVGIGVATGRVVAGNIGTKERYEYTVIGDAVNVAARLTELAKHDYDGVLASEDTIRDAHEVANVLWHSLAGPTPDANVGAPSPASAIGVPVGSDGQAEATHSATSSVDRRTSTGALSLPNGVSAPRREIDAAAELLGWAEVGTVIVRGRTQPTKLFQPRRHSERPPG